MATIIKDIILKVVKITKDMLKGIAIMVGMLIMDIAIKEDIIKEDIIKEDIVKADIAIMEGITAIEGIAFIRITIMEDIEDIIEGDIKALIMPMDIVIREGIVKGIGAIRDNIIEDKVVIMDIMVHIKEGALP